MNRIYLLMFILSALIGFVLSSGCLDTDVIHNTARAGTQWIVNNTNKAPNVPGHSPGTGERLGDNTTYWTNSSPIQIFLYSHANTTGQAAEIHLFINGTKVSDTSGRALGIAEQSNRSIVATVPQYANYSVEMVNYHHYEWYEYPILTGNVSTTITSATGGTTGAGCVGNSGNCSFDLISVNGIKTNASTTIDLYNSLVNTSGNTINSLDINSFIDISSSEIVGVNQTLLSLTPTNILLQNTNSINNYWQITQEQSTIRSNTANYSFNQTASDWHGADLLNINKTNATGSIFERRDDADIGSVSFINLNPLVGAGRTVSLFGLNRIFNESTRTWFNGTYMNASGTGFSIDTQSYYAGTMPSFKLFRFYPNSTSFNYWFSSDNITTNVLGGNFTVTDGNATINGNMSLNPTLKPSGITMYSPDGNDWCLTISNAGTMVISTSPCKLT